MDQAEMKLLIFVSNRGKTWSRAELIYVCRSLQTGAILEELGEVGGAREKWGRG